LAQFGKDQQLDGPWFELKDPMIFHGNYADQPSPRLTDHWFTTSFLGLVYVIRDQKPGLESYVFVGDDVIQLNGDYHKPI